MQYTITLSKIAVQNILDTLQVFKEEQLLYKPTDGVFSVGEHLHHIGYSIHWCIDNLILNQKYPHQASPVIKDIDELSKYLKEACDRWMQLLQTNDYPPEKIPYWLEIIDHSTYHRAQLAVYLRFLQLKPPPYKFI